MPSGSRRLKRSIGVLPMCSEMLVGIRAIPPARLAGGPDRAVGLGANGAAALRRGQRRPAGGGRAPPAASLRPRAVMAWATWRIGSLGDRGPRGAAAAGLRLLIAS